MSAVFVCVCACVYVCVVVIFLNLIACVNSGSRERALVVKALTRLREANLLSATDFIKAWSKIIEELDVIEHDILLVRRFIAEFIAAGIRAACVTKSQFAVLLERNRGDNCRTVSDAVQELLLAAEKGK